MEKKDNTDPVQGYLDERKAAAANMQEDQELRQLSLRWLERAFRHKYAYNFSWAGRPIIKLPQDVIAMQEIIWSVKPDLIIETGIAHGGSVVFSASMLELLGGNRMVVAIDLDIREHNRRELEKHPLSKRIKLLQGDSISAEIVSQAQEIAEKHKTILVVLDSCHSHAHVLKELHAYSRFVTKGSYLIVPDTLIEFFPRGFYHDRPWDVGNNTYTALQEFLSGNDNFAVDQEIENKLLITEAFGGYLRRIK